MTHTADVQKAQSEPRSDDLQSAVTAATAKFRAANAKSLAQHSAATAVMPGGNTRTVLYHDPFLNPRIFRTVPAGAPVAVRSLSLAELRCRIKGSATRGRISI